MIRMKRTKPNIFPSLASQGDTFTDYRDDIRGLQDLVF